MLKGNVGEIHAQYLHKQDAPLALSPIQVSKTGYPPLLSVAIDRERERERERERGIFCEWGEGTQQLPKKYE